MTETILNNKFYPQIIPLPHSKLGARLGDPLHTPSKDAFKIMQIKRNKEKDKKKCGEREREREREREVASMLRSWQLA